MVTNVVPSPNSVVPRIVAFVNNHDLTLRVTQYTMPLKAGEDGRDKILSVTDFQVTRQPLIDSSDGQYIKGILATPEFAEHRNHIINLDEHNASAVGVILCAVYRKNGDWMTSTLGRDRIASSLTLHWEKLWDIVVSNRCLKIKAVHLNEWFGLWYTRLGQPHDSRLLYPCFVFDHARGFASITKDLVHNHSYIKEYKNENHPDLRLPYGIMSALNAARGHIKANLAKGLWNPMKVVLDARCNCNENTFFVYFQAFKKTRGHPVEQQSHKSVNQVCQDLDNFSKYFTLPESHDCHSREDWVQTVKDAISEAREHFDGLCLDCMAYSQHKFLEDDNEYWGYLAHQQWDTKCRISHDQASWYSSFMGRANTRDWWLKRNRIGNRGWSAV